MILGVGIPLSRRYGPELRERRRSDHPMEMILALAEGDAPYHLYLRRPGELDTGDRRGGAVFVTFFSPRQAIPDKVAPHHFRFPLQASGVYRSIVALLALVQEEFRGQEVHVHLGWPLSAWLDRMATGVFVANLIRLPKLFPGLHFEIEHHPLAVLDRPAPARELAGAALVRPACQGRWGARQSEPERRATTRRTLDADLTAVGLDDVLRNRQA